MNKYDIEMNLERSATLRETWSKAIAEYRKQYLSIMARLIHEAAAQHMSVKQVAALAGIKPREMRALMKRVGLDPRMNRALLADIAAKALAENAELLGIDPREMDLTSPLAYLPMGEQLRIEIREHGRTPITLLNGEETLA